MDPVLQRIGDVTIQKVAPKPKDSPAVPPNPPETNEGNVKLEENKNAEQEIVNEESKSSNTYSNNSNSNENENYQMNLKRTMQEEIDHETLSKKTKVDHSDVIDSNQKVLPIKKASIQSDSEDEGSEYDSESESEEDCDDLSKNESNSIKSDFIEKLVQEPLQVIEPSEKPKELEGELSDYDYDITEKLKEMGEISVETVKKADRPKKVESSYLENEISVTTVKKKEPGEEGDEEKSMGEKKGGPINLRKNIREVMDETQLDESTLAAQRQEAERLRRVQEQQRIIREVQRQVAHNRMQNKVLSLLQGGSSTSMKSLPGTSNTRIGSTVLVKLPNGQTKPMTRIAKRPFDLMRIQKPATGLNVPTSQSSRSLISMKRPPGHLTPSVSIAPVSKPPLHSHPPSSGPSMTSDSESDTDSLPPKPTGKVKGKDVVMISSSSDDDCIVVSESETAVEDDDDPEDDPCNSGMHTNDEFNTPDEQGRVVINVGHPTDEPDLYVAPQIARIIKPHQIGGVRFLYDNLVESIERFNTSTGFGCILAHSMGLGKTLQVVCFCDIFLRHTPATTILCIMPINTLQNWLAEFNMWLPTEENAPNNPLMAHGEVRPRTFNLHVLNDSHKTLVARAKVIHAWRDKGGVLLIGYEQYRLLSMRRHPRSRKKGPQKEVHEDEKSKLLFDEVHEALVKPGPDLIICDEGHRIKNSHASISQALKQIRSKRRVVLTGYPLQNNLLEYWCMVDFVRPNYLGTKTEFCNMFERPIQNGQCIDSTPQDIKLMRYRAHVLHSLLVGFVQRRSHAVLQTALPQKEEYVLLVRMTDFQRKLYDTFMNEVVRTQAVPNPLKAFAVCCKIWNHPDVLYHFLKKRAGGETVDIDLEEVAAGAVTPGVVPEKAPTKRGPKAGKGGKKNQNKPAASVMPNTSCADPIPASSDQQLPLPSTMPASGLPANPLPASQHTSPSQTGNYPGIPSPMNPVHPHSQYQYPNHPQQQPPHLHSQQTQQQQQQSNSQQQQFHSQPNQSNQFYPPSAQNYPSTPLAIEPSQPATPSSGPDMGIGSSNGATGVGCSNGYFHGNYQGTPHQPMSSQHQQQQSNYWNQSPQQQPQQHQQQQQPQQNFGQSTLYPIQHQQSQQLVSSNYFENSSSNQMQQSGSFEHNSIIPASPHSGSYNGSLQTHQNFPSQNPPTQNATQHNALQQHSSSQHHQQQQQHPQHLSQHHQHSQQHPSHQHLPPQQHPHQQHTVQQHTPQQQSLQQHPLQQLPLPHHQHLSQHQSPHLQQLQPLSAAQSQSQTSILHPWEKKEPIISEIKPLPPTIISQSENCIIKSVEIWKHPVIKTEDLLASPYGFGDEKPKIDPIKDEIRIIKPDPTKNEIRIFKPDPNKDEIPKFNMDPSKDQIPLFKEDPSKDQIPLFKTEPSNDQVPLQQPFKVEPGSELVPKEEDDTKTIAGNGDPSANVNKSSLKEDPGIPYDWATELLKGYVPGILENSAKMEILFCIIKESIALGDRLLLFSQSLITLDLVEMFLQSNVVPGDENDTHWAKSSHYYRLDGSTSALEREKLINEFNSNPNIHLFLVSTRAGSLGINLVGANRVVVLDASWNPCHDTQAVCRVYRYGQRKPCFVYRFVMDNCLEKKIYDRQINKQGMADRVVDECNPDAHLSMKEVSTLCWDDEKDSEEKDWSFCKERYLDVVLQKVLDNFGKKLNKEPFQHESLLVDRKEKQLSKQEKRLAKRGYEKEKQAARAPTYNISQAGGLRGQQRPIASVRPMQQPDVKSRWIPAEQWQRQGMTAQEMTLPLDVVIPTNQPDKGNIVLKAGQKVLVLKSPKGIYMQLECGKIVAIKTAIKVRGKAEDKDTSKTLLKQNMAHNHGMKNSTNSHQHHHHQQQHHHHQQQHQHQMMQSVLPNKRIIKPFIPGAGFKKLNVKSIRQNVPNLVNRLQGTPRKVQGRSKPYQMSDKMSMNDNVLMDTQMHRKSIDSSTDSQEMDNMDGMLDDSMIQPSQMHDIMDESAMCHVKSEPGTPVSKNYRHGGAKHRGGSGMSMKSSSSSSTSSALQQLEQSASSFGEDKQAFQETLDNITNSYGEDGDGSGHSSNLESNAASAAPTVGGIPPTAEVTPIQDNQYLTGAEQVKPEPTSLGGAAADYGAAAAAASAYGNYYGYNHMGHYPPPHPQAAYGSYPPPPPQYDMMAAGYPPHPPQQGQYNYGAMYPPQAGYHPPPQYPPQAPPPQYDYGPPPPGPQPMYSAFHSPYPQPQYPPPPPQGMYPPAPAYPEYQYGAAPAAAPPPHNASAAYYPGS